MDRHVFLMGLGAFVSPMIANAEPTSSSGLYIIYGAGALVLLMIIVVAFVSVRFVRVFKTIVADDVQREQAVDGQLSKPVQSDVTPPTDKAQILVRRIRWISYTVVSSAIMVATSIVFINATSNRTGVASATEIPSPPPSDEPFVLSKDAEVLTKGKQIFAGTCSACHRNDGGGSQIGPNLTDEFWLHGGEPDSVFQTIKHGVAAKGMPAWGKALKPEDLNAVASFVLSLDGSEPRDAREPQGVKFVRTSRR